LYCHESPDWRRRLCADRPLLLQAGSQPSVQGEAETVAPVDGSESAAAQTPSLTKAASPCSCYPSPFVPQPYERNKKTSHRGPKSQI